MIFRSKRQKPEAQVSGKNGSSDNERRAEVDGLAVSAAAAAGEIPQTNSSRLDQSGLLPSRQDDQREASSAATDSAQAQIAQLRPKLHELFGKVTLAMMSLSRYKHLTLSELRGFALDPLLRDKVAIATASKEEASAEGAVAGIGIWASVSEAVDQKIRDQVRAGTFPVRLKPEDWNSGEINWLLDVIAPNQQLTTIVTANFSTVVKGKTMNVHPIVHKLIDAEALGKLGITANRTKASTAEKVDRINDVGSGHTAPTSQTLN